MVDRLRNVLRLAAYVLMAVGLVNYVWSAVADASASAWTLSPAAVGLLLLVVSQYLGAAPTSDRTRRGLAIGLALAISGVVAIAWGGIVGDAAIAGYGASGLLVGASLALVIGRIASTK
jgi:hypothetical protein